VVLITLWTGVIYSNIYHAPFVFDGRTQLLDNTKIKDLGNYLSLERLLEPRGVVNLTFALNYKFGELHVFGYHLVNVLVHILSGFLVYFLALTVFQQLSRLPQSPGSSSPESPSDSNRTMALVAALIFVAHPVQTQAVTYTVQRYASMASMFYMASVLFYLKARIMAHSALVQGKTAQGGREFHGARLSALYGLSVLCGMLAFLSKQNTASLPGAILLVEYVLIDRTWQGWKKKIPWVALSVGLWALFVLYISVVFSGGPGGRGLLEDVSDVMQETPTVSRWSYLCTQFNVVVIYIRLLLLPVHQNLDYFYAFKRGFFDAYTPLAFLVVTGLAGLGIWSMRKRPLIALAILWFFITLSVESSVIPIRDALVEHRLYLPMVGFALLAAYLLFQGFSTRRSWALVIAVSLILSLGTATYLRNRVYRDEIALWADVISKNPQNPRGYNNLGNLLMMRGRVEEAIHHYAEVLRLRPDYAGVHNNLGFALMYQGRFEEAIGHYAEALRLAPDLAVAHNNLGVVLTRQGKHEEAINQYAEALRLNPDYVEARRNLEISLRRMGKPAGTSHRGVRPVK
jgi:tetratricopeptide (TPR) repeat protein